MPHFIFIQQISALNILNMLYNLHFFSSKRRLFHNATLLGFCITHILNTGCAKLKKKSVAKRLKEINARRGHLSPCPLILFPAVLKSFRLNPIQTYKHKFVFGAP